MQKNLNNISSVIFEKSTCENGSSFVGIRVQNNQIHFYYPESYDLDFTGISRERDDIISILKTISFGKESINEEFSSDISSRQNGARAFNSYIWLINDYLHNGIYFARERKYSEDCKGKINWKKTLKRQPIVVDSKILYTNFITESRYSIESILTEIYKHCCQISFNNIGWLFNVSFTNQSNIYYNKEYFIRVINDLLLRSFDDKKKIMLLHLKRILSGNENISSNETDFIYGVDSYEYVFEKMIDRMFGNIEKISDFYPNAKWNLVGFPKALKTSNLRPDTIIKKGESVYIIDSKYYRYGSTKITRHLPETTSIQKQITYGEYIGRMKGIKKVSNVFVMPYNKSSNQFGFRQNLVHFGIAEAEWKDVQNEHRIVFGLLIDTKFLVTSYMKDQEIHSGELIQLVEEIRQSIKQ